MPLKSKKQVERAKSRRAYRRFFRRVRFYLPAATLLLLAIVFFLPIKARWLRESIETRIEQVLKQDVRIGSVQIVLAEARVEATDVSILGDDGRELFSVRRLLLDGKVSDFLGGGELWPSEVEADGFAEARVVRNADGQMALSAELQELIALFDQGNTGKSTNNQSTRTKSKDMPDIPEIGPTPRIILRDLTLTVKDLLPQWPETVLIIDRLEAAPRSSSQAPFRIQVAGTLVTDSVEPYSGRGIYYPKQNRLTLNAELKRASFGFEIAEMGKLATSGEDIAIQLDLTQDQNSNQVSGYLAADIRELEARKDEFGGERWVQRPLSARARFRFSPENMNLTADHLTIFGGGVDIDLSADMHLAGDPTGQARLRINEIPSQALTLAKGEASRRLGIEIDEYTTSPTLKLDMSVDGNFTELENLDYQITTRIAGWQIRSDENEDPLIIEDFSSFLSPRKLEVRRCALSIANQEIKISGEIPISSSDSREYGALNLSLTGNTEPIAQELIKENLLPIDIASIALPFSLRMDVPISLQRDEEMSITPDVDFEEFEGSLTWSPGTVKLRNLADIIEVDQGAARITREGISIRGLNASIPDLTFTINSSLIGLPWVTPEEDLQCDIQVRARGRIQELLYVLSRQLPLPLLPADLDGNFQLEGNLSGAPLNPESLPDFNIRLLLEEATATVPTPARSVPLYVRTAEIYAEPQTVLLRKADIRVDEPGEFPSEGQLKGNINNEAIEISGDVRTSFDFLASILPKEFQEIAAHGEVPGKGTFKLYPDQPLPEGQYLAQRWLKLLSKPGLSFRFKEEEHKDGAHLIGSYNIVYQQSTPFEMYPRVFPHKITNVRGAISFNDGTFLIEEGLIDIGETKDVKVSGEIILGRPVLINFKSDMGYVDINKWFSGWGEQPWAQSPVSFPPRWKSIPESYQFIDINGEITAKSFDVLQFSGTDLKTNFHFESWSRDDPVLELNQTSANAYEGKIFTDMRFVFPPDELPYMTATANFEDANLDSYLDTLLERDQSMDGVIRGWNLEFAGQILNYPSYTGSASFEIRRSSVVGNIIMAYAKEFVNIGSKTGGRDSTVTGSVDVRNSRVEFNDLRIKNPNVDLATDGGIVDFGGRLNFDVVMSVVSQRLQNIPIISQIKKPIDWLVGKSLVVYRVTGVISDPKVTPIPALMSHTQVFDRLFGKVGETSGEQR